MRVHRAGFWLVTAAFGAASFGCGSSTTGPSGGLAVACAANPTSGIMPLLVAFTAQVTAGGPSYQLNIQYGDGTASADPNSGHLYANPGTYSAQVQVFSNGQSASCNQTITVLSIPAGNAVPPKAVFRTTPDPPQGPSPLTVEFNVCHSSDPQNRPLTFAFDFGDGHTASGNCRQQHTYSKGNFNATVCVSNGPFDTCKRYDVQGS